MKAVRRPYRMRARARAADATRTRIIEACRGLLGERWYDEMTLRDVAARAGVSLGTVVNHFGSKDGLFNAVVERLSAELPQRRSGARPGDVAGAMALLLDEYERDGDMVVRALALEGRVAAMAPALARGRAEHRDWIERTFAHRLPDRGRRRQRLVDQHVAVTDVYVWKLLRRDLGRSREETAAAMNELVDELDPTRSAP